MKMTEAEFQRIYRYVKLHYGIDMSKKKEIMTGRLDKSKNLQKVPNKIFQSTLCRFLFHFNSSQNFSDRRGNT